MNAFAAGSGAPAYIEFGVQSNFSLLRGASRPEELVVTACALGHAGMGLADRNTVSGVVRAWSQSKAIRFSDEGEPRVLPYHPGCRLAFADGTPDVLAYPQDRKGWGHLCRLLTTGNLREESEKGAPLLYLHDLLEWGDNISLAILPDPLGPAGETLTLLARLKERFGRSLWLAVAPDYRGNDRFRLAQAQALADAAGLPLMATNDVLYHAAERRPLQDVLTAIRLRTTVAGAGFALAANAERHLKEPAEMARLFRAHPQALAETQRFAATLSFSLSELQHNYPDEPTRDGATPQQELERLTWEGAARFYPEGVSADLAERIEKELALIGKMKYARYFLTVHDIVRYARSRDILCQGRGSAANSVVCYLLGITAVAPEQIDSLFERFISEKRNEPPDIDVDFEHQRREEVMAYIYEKYKEKHTALACAVISYRGRSALREVAKAMGLSQDVQGALSGSIWGWWTSSIGSEQAKAGGLDKEDPITRHVLARASELVASECPRHLSQHVGGFVITRDRLDEIVPIVRTGMETRRMVEWNKDDLDAVGILKVDVLALGMLSCMKRAFTLLEDHYRVRDAHGRPITLATMRKEDPLVYDMICRADTLGVFQVESRAQMSMLPRLKPRCFYDLVIEVAIVRPGPIQGDMVHPFLRRREGKEDADYYKPELKEILGKTLGVPLFQEQAMKIAIVAGGFTPDEADLLRRAMATFRRTGKVGLYEKRMIDGMVARGYPKEFAERCFKQIEGFGEYGFPESHAASFALLVYASCWFKAFYPDVFCAAILNSQPMGFYKPAQLIRDAAEHGVEIRPVDINASGWECTLEKAAFDPARVSGRHVEMRRTIRTMHALRMGFNQIRGLGKERMETFVTRRGDGYVSVRDVWLRSGLDAGEIGKLAEADAFRSIGLDRRAALWAVRALDARSAVEALPLFDRPGLDLPDREPVTRLPPMRPGEQVVQDYRSLGLSLKAHPVSFLRARLNRAGVTPNARLGALSDGARVTVSGLVLVRQRPGKGNAIFLTLEDEGAIANIVIWKRTFERYRAAIMGGRFVRVTGKLQSEGDVIHIVAERIEDLSSWLGVLLAPEPEPEAWPIVPAARNPQALARSAHSVMPKGRNFH
ncbi:error-prone DNA polymerase [Aquamicrobium defluvii]|uniref:Error-prone DNA polymerase n=1 Tax=Aquamicrobium defluvii TaxID=69279 RepID=A0A011UBQ7_9HYPH|nr:error-prone DNA polymerase [Aquamicrobium defluvii]EXL03378.1 DNA polymerase [Aquamicrobium defluvii]EZQ14679.1 DNA polymerase [Halopseudomonas bauzanensis]TDR34055.1 DnaE-like error-prone DNA polymerase [Aquamicrobium defluvii]